MKEGYEMRMAYLIWPVKGSHSSAIRWEGKLYSTSSYLQLRNIMLLLKQVLVPFPIAKPHFSVIVDDIKRPSFR
jgi:hypothetical protein